MGQPRPHSGGATVSQQPSWQPEVGLPFPQGVVHKGPGPDALCDWVSGRKWYSLTELWYRTRGYMWFGDDFF